MTYVYVCLGAGVGAPARYLIDRAVQTRHDAALPWGTLLVNVLGSLILGLLTALASGDRVPAEVSLVVGTGFCGALTTYSTFGFETVRLFEDGERLDALLNVALSLSAGIAAAFVGYALATAL